MIAVYIITGVESEFTNILFNAISDAYLQVSTFVAGTFFVFYGVERALKVDAAVALQKANVWQVPVAAALGALPGCGGAIIVVTQYVSGRLSFGSVVAVLTATMGDAAFLLIAQEPITGLMMVAIGFFVGTFSGWVVDYIHDQDFLRGSIKNKRQVGIPRKDASTPLLDKIWLIFMIPGLALGVLVAFQVDVDALFANEYLDKPASLFAVIGGGLAVIMRLAPYFSVAGNNEFLVNGKILRRTVADTNFVTLWVILAFLMFDLSVYFFAIDPKQLFSGYTVLTPMIAVLVGLLPGCGPQLLVTTMYLAGVIPLSAQIGNTISNDGDALFPAIAIAPKVAVIATMYSAIPAIIISYSWLFLFE